MCVCVEFSLLINVHIVPLLVSVQSRHTLVTLAEGEHSLIKNRQRGPYCVRRLSVQRCNHYLQLTTMSLLLHPSLRSKPRPSPPINSYKSPHRIYYSLYASIFSSVTHLSPSFTSSLLCFYPPVHSIIGSIYLFYSPFCTADLPSLHPLPLHAL